MRIRRWGAAAVAAVVVMLVAVTAAGMAAKKEEPVGQPKWAWPAVAAVDARCGEPATGRLPAGGPVMVTLPPVAPFAVGGIPAEAWRNPPSRDVSWKLKFLGLSWMMPIAAQAHADGRRDVLDALVAQAVAFHRQNPDTGRQDDGWDEGTAMRRLETQNCLYALTNAPELVPGMESDAVVQFTGRYYGPPHHPVHNHGLMANLQLVRAADLLQRPKWKRTALERIAQEAPKAFSPMGTSLEQSAQYQHVNANLWGEAMNLLDASPDSRPTADAIRRTVRDAYRMLSWMTQPDGNLVQLGNSDQGKGKLTDAGATSVRDDVAGFLAGRWSWTDPDTTYYTVRYGPPRRAHGHHDQAGGVTFWSHGVRVLVGAGRHSYNKDDPFRTFQMTAQAENTAVPANTYFDDDARADVASARFARDKHTVTVRDQLYHVPHTRTIEVEPGSMTVADHFDVAPSWQQSWHLDPKWKMSESSVTRMVFRHPAGRTLTVTTTGRFTNLQRGVTGTETAGWHFPRAGVKEANYQITVTNNGNQSTTRFQIR